MSEWTERPAVYWYKRSIMDENYLDAIITIIGHALPSVQKDVEVLDKEWNSVLGELNSEYPLEDGRES